MKESSMDEAKRLATLHSLGILDTPANALIDGIVRTAAALCNAPMALVSLVDNDRQWFKANYGLESVSEVSRDIAFYGVTVMDSAVLVVEDAHNDDRFRNDRFVTGEPGLRFYAGAPLIAKNGMRLGTLCVLDTRPNSVSEKQKEQLAGMADVVVDLLYMESKSAAIDSEVRIPRRGRVSKEERILSHARELLIKEGTRAFSVRKVASAAGMSIGHLQHYFPDRAALLDAIIESLRTSFNRYFTSNIASILNPVDQFVACAKYINDQGPDRHMVLLLRELWALAAHDTKVARSLSDFYSDCRQLATKILRRANPKLDETEAGLRAATAISLLSGAFLYVHPWMEDAAVEGFSERILECVVSLPFQEI